MVEICHGSVLRSTLVTALVALPGYIPLRLTISHAQLGCIYKEFRLCGGCVGGWILVLMKARSKGWPGLVRAGAARALHS